MDVRVGEAGEPGLNCGQVGLDQAERVRGRSGRGEGPDGLLRAGHRAEDGLDDGGESRVAVAA